MAKGKARAVRFEQDFDRLIEAEATRLKVTPAELIARLVEEGYRRVKDERDITLREVPEEPEKTTATKPKISTGKRGPYDKFMIPIGDTVNVVKPGTGPQYGTTPECMWRSGVWWCPESKVDLVTSLAKDWVENGFSLEWGKEGKGTHYEPEVIEYKDQERGKRLPKASSRKGVPAYVGDRMVWLEIVDPTMALEFMKTRSDIPTAIRYDAIRYQEDTLYKTAVDKANDYFITYYEDGKPTRLSKTDSDLISELYDV